MAVSDKLIKISPNIWEIPTSYKNGMLVPARIYASVSLMQNMDEGVYDQVTNVATLPGITRYSFCMPDGHRGYGFPIGGAAAFDIESGVISPGGIGFDINCGMRLVRTNLTLNEVKPRIKQLMNKLFESIPAGVGCKGSMPLKADDLQEAVEQGSTYVVKKGFGKQADLEMTEENGSMKGADSTKISQKAIERGKDQVGTLGSGNHYLEVQVAKTENIKDRKKAEIFGIKENNQIVVMFHSGSRGFGHQIATDYLQSFLKASEKYNYRIRDRELAYAPFMSQEGQDYFAAMKCAINMAFLNRQVILHRIREVFSDLFHKSPEDLGIEQVYDVAHNTAKIEEHLVDGDLRKLLVHRKGATCALGPESEGLPEKYRKTGQPVIIGGSMETGSYLLVGVPEGEQTFFTTAHGSGRTMSRSKAKKMFRGKELQKEMEKRGIYVHTASYSGLAEEAGAAYKDIDQVIEATKQAGLSKPVVRFIPVGNIKG
jgi:tRNA-splicing ligase RtcB